MRTTVTPEKLPGLRVIEHEPFTDQRGFFYESHSRRTLAAALGIDLEFVQDNHSRSVRDVVRGLHYQAPPAQQWRLVRCTVGEVYDVVVDIDEGSHTFGRWVGVVLTASNHRQLLIPPSYAHGFAVLSEVAEVQYKCTAFHDPPSERTIHFADPELQIAWPVANPITSTKDDTARSFQEYRDHPDFPSPSVPRPRVAVGSPNGGAR
jgi:dTDP-4-dehydrorhamnose 3,5-epimerase